MHALILATSLLNLTFEDSVLYSLKGPSVFSGHLLLTQKFPFLETEQIVKGPETVSDA